ncbi:MAG: GNAT family N-acetyltransferase [Clostridia bacterium]|nr:GNAT family N-acetyltransferase [Clostridia bacterium]
MSINIKEVISKKDLKKWIEFPNSLYKDNDYYVPFLANDEMETFTPDKNPAYAFCETKLFLAYKDNKIVGRIAGLINHAYNKKWGKNAIRFTRFDFIDDYEVSEALFQRVVNWGKENELTEIMGPIGFTDMDHEGMLIEGFEELNLSITFYNHPYYIDHMERLGLQKDIDWFEYRINVPESLDPRFARISNRICEKNGYSVVTYNNRKVLYNDALEAFKIIDIAFSKLYGTVPLTPEVIKHAIDGYVPVVNLDYVCSIKDKDGNIIGFGVLVPSIAKALKKSDGKMLPFGVFRLLRALGGKNDTLEMFFVAVHPDYQAQGLPAILISTLAKKIIENGVKYCETGPMLETNTAVHSMWRHFEKRQHRRRRCYIKAI